MSASTVRSLLPMNAPGLSILARESFHRGEDAFDRPLSSRFDEGDAILMFDKVLVPHERMIIDGDLEAYNGMLSARPGYTPIQATIRSTMKLRFLAGIAHRTAEINGIAGFPQVRETLGQLSAEASMVDAFVVAMESRGQQRGRYFVPDRQMLYAAQTLTQQLYAKVINTLRELAGGGMIMLPSSVKDFGNPEIADLIGKTQQSPAGGAVDRVKFYKLAWDAVGSEFASRHTQYEMFYAGATFVTKGHAFRTYDWKAATALLDRMLSSYHLSDEIASQTNPPDRAVA